MRDAQRDAVGTSLGIGVGGRHPGARVGRTRGRVAKIPTESTKTQTGSISKCNLRADKATRNKIRIAGGRIGDFNVVNGKAVVRIAGGT